MTASTSVFRTENLQKKFKLMGYDSWLILVVVIMISFGLVMVYSASWDVSFRLYSDPNAIIRRQVVNLFVGLIALTRSDAFSEDDNTQICDAYEIPDCWMGLDAGPKTNIGFSFVIADSKTILWNGPVGVFEMEKFSKGTIEIGNAIADATAEGAFSLVGGGDSVAAVKQFGLAKKVSYISTGGGAMLEMLEGKTLPGIEAMMK